MMRECTFIGGSMAGKVEEVKPFIQRIEIPVPNRPAESFADIEKEGISAISGTFHVEWYQVVDITDMDGRTITIALLENDKTPMRQLVKVYQNQQTMIGLLDKLDDYKRALADAIRRPMGIVPDSAEGLLSQADLDAAEDRRRLNAIPR